MLALYFSVFFLACPHQCGGKGRCISAQKQCICLEGWKDKLEGQGCDEGKSTSMNSM